MRIPFSLICLLSLCATLMQGTASSVIVMNPLAEYGADGDGDPLDSPFSEFDPTLVAPGVDAGKLTYSGSKASLEGGFSVPGSVFLNIEILSTTAAAAIANEQYFQFTLKTLGAHMMTFSSISFDVTRGGSSGPRGWVLRSSADGFSSDIATQVVPTSQPEFTPNSVPLAGVIADTDEITFRLYGYSTAAPGFGLFFDNIHVLGVVAPEPTAGLLGLTAIFLFARRRRRGS